jgi:hypothetical protein
LALCLSKCQPDVTERFDFCVPRSTVSPRASTGKQEVLKGWMASQPQQLSKVSLRSAAERCRCCCGIRKLHDRNASRAFVGAELRCEFLLSCRCSCFSQMVIMFVFSQFIKIFTLYIYIYICKQISFRVPGYRTRVRVRFPALQDLLRSSGSGTGFTQPHDYN